MLHATYTLTATNGYIEATSKTLTNPQNTVCGSPSGYQCSFYCDVLDIPLNTNLYIFDPAACTDCQYNWTTLPNYSISDTTPKGCNFVVCYAIRTCGIPARREVLIWRIELQQPGCIPPDNVQTIYYWATEKVLKDLATKYPPGDWYLRSTRYSAYNGTSFIVSCGDFNTCCSKRYILDTAPPRISAVYPIIGSCLPPQGICVTTCGQEWDSIGLLPRLPSFESNKVSEENLGIISFVQPNPADGLTEIHIQMMDKGKITFAIFDMNGREIDLVEIDKTGYEAICQFDVKKNTEGAYTYQILFNGRIISTGRFVVVH